MRLLGSQTLQYGLGYAMSAGSRLVRDLVLAKILGPATFGLWASLSVVRQYSAYSDLGFTNGLGRLLPRLVHQGEAEEARAVMGTAWRVAMSGTAVFAVGALVWAWPQIRSGEWPVVWGVATIVALAFLDKQQMYSSVVYSSVQRVGATGLFMGLLGLTELLLCIAFARLLGLYGLYAALIGAMLVTLGAMAVRQPLRSGAAPDRRVLGGLAAVSLVLMGYGLTNVALHNADRVVIMLRLGSGAELGRYHVLAILSLVVNHLPYVVLSVLVPKIYRYGSDRPEELQRYVLVPTAMMAVLAVIAGSLLWQVGPPALAAYVPWLQNTRTVLTPLLLAELLFSVAMVPANIVVALERGFLGLLVRVVTVALAFMGGYLVLARGGSVVGVAWMMVAAQTIGFVALGAMAAWGTAVPFGRFLLVGGLPVAYGAAVQWAVWSGFGSWATSLPLVVGQTMCTLALLSPLALVPLVYWGRGPLAAASVRRFLHWPEAA